LVNPKKRLFVADAFYALLTVLNPHPVAAATPINMSHDLVSMGIAGQNLIPNNPALDSRPILTQVRFWAATQSGALLFTADKGAYYFPTHQNNGPVFADVNDVTFDFGGSTLYYIGPIVVNGLNIVRCNNFKLTNLTTDYVNPPYTHVRITSVNSAQRTIAYQTLPGWPDPAAFNTATSIISPLFFWGIVFRNGAVVPGTSRMQLTGPISGNTIALTQDNTPWTQSATLSTLQTGDTLVIALRGGGGAISVRDSDNVMLQNITVLGANNSAVDLHATSNSTVDNVRVMPRPGTGLLGSNADGIFFEAIRQNNHIKNSYVARTLDDAIIMSSQYAATIVSQTGPRTLHVTRNVLYRFANGTAVNFVDPLTDLEIPSGAVIVSQNPPDDPFNYGLNQTEDLIFDRDLPTLSPGMGMAYGSASDRGSGSIVEDSMVEDINGGRGIWVQGGQGITIQRNVVRRTSCAGIIVRQDTEAFPSPPARDITIDSNSVEGVPSTPCSTGTALAGIQVVSTNNQNFSFSTSAANSNIAVQNNYIADSGRSGIWVGELNGGSIQNNVVIRWNQHPELPLFGIPPQFQNQVLADFPLPIVVHYNTGVTSQNNSTASSSSITAPVSLTPSSASVPVAGASGSFAVSTVVSGFAWAAAASDAWITITSVTAASVSYSVAANTSTSPRTGRITVAGEVFTITQAGTGPTPEGVAPAFGSGTSQSFMFSFSDAGGYQNFQVVDVLIANALDGRHACYVAFVPSSATGGSVYLVDDVGDAGGPYQGLVLPGGVSISNSQCTINGTGSSVSGSGNNLVLTLNMTFSSAFSGNKVLYLSAQDKAGVNSGWHALGTWGVPGGVITGPSVVGVRPAQTSGLGQTYTFTFSDTNGWQDLSVANILINTAIDGRHACYLAFAPSGPSGGSLYLVDDAGDAGGPYQGVVLPGTQSASNSQCTVNGSGSTVTTSGNTLTLSLNMSFAPSFAGDQLFFLAARSNTLNSDWQAVGTVSVP